MKRRIDTWESFSDVTDSPHLSVNEYDGELHLEDPPLQLDNEPLWAQLLAAQEHLHEVEARVMAEAKRVPLDAFELQCGLKLMRMLDSTIQPEGPRRDLEEWDRIQDALIAHAHTLEVPIPQRPYTHMVVIVREPGMPIDATGFHDAKSAAEHAEYAGNQWSGTYTCLVTKGPLT